ncbi:hypothetical protein [Butyrivibrio sp. XPD2006]|uniref:hypothetical protein n=1 Tax=Butyrivibrio sp. XPD2006 TaxID=1280668 RepID=UPI0003B4DA4A|nr:hypothetical protein [Butyrivibrio sp. XPD2006]
MIKKISRVLNAVVAMAMAIAVFSVPSFAVESTDLPSQLTNQADQPNPGATYMNEPLDNAIPVIYKYEVGGDGYIVPGEEFTLKFTVYNPGVVSKIGNIRLDLSQSNNLVYPKYGATNSVYIGYLSALSYSEGEITLIASKDISSKELPINIFMFYTDNYSTANQQQLVATLPVSSSGNLSLSSLDVPSAMHIGKNNRLSVTYRNNGLSPINDVVLHLNGDTINAQDITLGSIGSNASVTNDIYVEFLKLGQQIVKVNFSYTDSDGYVKETEPVDYSFEVKDFETTQNDDYAVYMRRRNIINRYMTLGVLIVCIIVLIIAFSMIRKEKNLGKVVRGGEKK